MARMSANNPPKRKAHPYIIGPKDDDILRAVYRYHYLSIDQICRLLYSTGGRTTAATRLKGLADAGYLQRIVIPSRLGNGPVVYTLARKGMKFLAEAGFSVPTRARPKDTQQQSYLFFSHTLAVNDVLISTELLSRSYPGSIELRQLLPELELKRNPVAVDDGAGGKLTIIPDAYIDLVLAGTERMCLALELDRGTEEQKKSRKKVRGLVAFAQGPYQQAYGTDALTVCVVATPGQPRLRQLYEWTVAELTAIGQQGEADLFRFTTFNPATLPPEQLFFGAGWFIPYSTKPVPLIDRTLLGAGGQPKPNGAAAPYA